MRVSVLIPTYDRPRFLGEAIRAALGSTIQDLEVVVGDNGDQGGRVCAEIGDSRVRYIRHAVPGGMASNWNALLDAARGEFCALCSDDDRFRPMFLERCFEQFCADPELVVVFTNHDVVSDRWRTTRSRLVDDGRHDDFARTFLATRPVAASAALFRREAWQDARPLPDTAAADMVLFGRIAEAGHPFFYLHESLMDYRSHDAMLSATEGFKDDAILAFQSLSFSDRAAERERRHLLGQAHLSRSTARLRRSDARGGGQDARRALVLLRGRSRAGALVPLALSVVPWLAGPAARTATLVRARRRVRRVAGGRTDHRVG